ncbi:MAG TPA: hypothetical protein VN493_26000 [Thermoanaerobaculia bacterium]|nr:hypothetical protein [Thermoanaerobaculia bacterium]
MTLKFRDNFVEVILQRLAAWRSLDQGRFKVLGRPHSSSPFLTISEDRDGDGVPSSVIKVLTIPDSDSSRHGWAEVLRWEKRRLEQEFSQRLPPLQWNQAQEAAQVLDVPLLVEDRVLLEPLSGFRRRDLLDDESRDREGERMALDVLVRPYVLRPSLADCGYGLERAAQTLWESFCRREGLELVQGENLLLRHFYREALVIKEAVRPGGEPDLFLTSAWRYARLRGEL